jgi:hypothetical protein
MRIIPDNRAFRGPRHGSAAGSGPAPAIPTLLVLRRGQVIARQTGAAPLAVLRTWVDSALASAAG